MLETIEDFFKKLLLFFPEKKDEYNDHIKSFSQRLDTVIIEDIFIPEIINLLITQDNRVLLNQIFEYFEQLSNIADEYLLNIFSVTIMECLGNDRNVLEIAQKYMGPKTIKLQYKADKDLGRVR